MNLDEGVFAGRQAVQGRGGFRAPCPEVTEAQGLVDRPQVRHRSCQEPLAGFCPEVSREDLRPQAMPRGAASAIPALADRRQVRWLFSVGQIEPEGWQAKSLAVDSSQRGAAV